jgi:hypothetical protein
METHTEIKPLVNSAQINCQEIALIAPHDTNEMGGKLQEMILNYYQDVLGQAQQSFRAALIIASVGTVFFLVALVSYVFMKNGDLSRIALISGSIIHVISGINFLLYAKTAKQFSYFHVCLERTNRFLLASTIANNIKDEVKKDNSLHELAQRIADAPMLNFDKTINGRRSQ